MKQIKPLIKKKIKKKQGKRVIVNYTLSCVSNFSWQYNFKNGLNPGVTYLIENDVGD